MPLEFQLSSSLSPRYTIIATKTVLSLTAIALCVSCELKQLLVVADAEEKIIVHVHYEALSQRLGSYSTISQLSAGKLVV
jgi:hypothetical protein